MVNRVGLSERNDGTYLTFLNPVSEEVPDLELMIMLREEITCCFMEKPEISTVSECHYLSTIWLDTLCPIALEASILYLVRTMVLLVVCATLYIVEYSTTILATVRLQISKVLKGIKEQAKSPWIELLHLFTNQTLLFRNTLEHMTAELRCRAPAK
jgi:hypothetical protein